MDIGPPQLKPAVRKDGSEFPVELAIVRIPGVEPPVFTAFLRDITEGERLARHNAYLREEIEYERGGVGITGGSPAIRKVLEQIEMVAPTDAGVLLSGEPGTGKASGARMFLQSHFSARRWRSALTTRIG